MTSVDLAAGRFEILPLDLGEVVLPPDHPQGSGALPILAYVVSHADGLLLFDTGVGEGNAEVDEVYSPRRIEVAVALATHGLSPADVTHVANCHLHFDHIGENARFPQIPIFVQEEEYLAIDEPDYTVPEWVNFRGATYEVLHGETEVIPGLRLLPTPGHTIGHQSLVVDDPSGVRVLAGQAVLTAAEWQGSTDPAVLGTAEAWDERAYERSLAQLRSLDPAVVYFAHDRTVWTRA